MKAFSRFVSNALILIVLQENMQPYTSHGIIRTAQNILFRRKLSVFYYTERY